jgi:CHC2 zinc finger
MPYKTKWPDSRQTSQGQKLTTSNPNDTHFAAARKAFSNRKLNRDSLPSPAKYLNEHGMLAKAPRGEWVSITCPVHAGGNESNPSLRVSLIDGHFKCMACSAKGGDVIALHRLITGASFMEAVLDLGGRFDG